MDVVSCLCKLIGLSRLAKSSRQSMEELAAPFRVVVHLTSTPAGQGLVLGGSWGTRRYPCSGPGARSRWRGLQGGATVTPGFSREIHGGVWGRAKLARPPVAPGPGVARPGVGCRGPGVGPGAWPSCMAGQDSSSRAAPLGRAQHTFMRRPAVHRICLTGQGYVGHLTPARLCLTQIILTLRDGPMDNPLEPSEMVHPVWETV